jgi:hypothetical protein
VSTGGVTTSKYFTCIKYDRKFLDRALKQVINVSYHFPELNTNILTPHTQGTTHAHDILTVQTDTKGIF